MMNVARTFITSTDGKQIRHKYNALKALGNINTLLSQSLQLIKKVNEDEQWDFCTDDILARRVNDAERLIKEVSDVVFQNKSKRKCNSERKKKMKVLTKTDIEQMAIEVAGYCHAMGYKDVDLY